MISLTKKQVIAGFLVTLLGIPGLAYATGIVSTPQYGLEDRGDWGETARDSVEITSSGWVYNPNSFEINLSTLDIGYAVKMNGVRLAEGGKDGFHIPSKNNTTIEVSTHLKPEKVPIWWAKHLNSGETSKLVVPISADLTLFNRSLAVDGVNYKDTINTDIEAKLDQAVGNIEGEYSYQAAPEGLSLESTETDIVVKQASASFGKVTREKTTLKAKTQVHNPNDYAIPTPQFNGELVMNSIEVASWQANNVGLFSSENSKIDPGETREVKFKVEMNNSKIDEWFVSHAANEEKTNAKINVRLGMSLGGTRITVPPGGLNCDFSFQTGILVDNQESDSNFSGCERRAIGSGSSSGDSGSSDSDSSGGSDDESGSVDPDPGNQTDGDDDGLLGDLG